MALLAVLLLAQPPILLLIRFSMARDAAVPFMLALFSSLLLLLHAAGLPFRLVLPPPRWRQLTSILLLLDTGIAAVWSCIPPATLLLPGWLTAALVVGGEASSFGLLLYWFWHAQQLGGPLSRPGYPLSPALALAQHAYDQQAANFQPTEAEFETWVRTLPTPVQRLTRQAGLKAMWAMPLFRRFVLEARGHRCVDFMAEHLSGEDFRRWVDATLTPWQPKA